MKEGDIVTIKHDCVTIGGNLIHAAGDKVTILAVEIEEAHYSKISPSTWITDRLRCVLLVGFEGYYQPESFYEYNIGEKVTKTSLCEKPKRPYKRKKFKSGSLVNTIKGVVIHPELGIPAYTFEEDESYVECRRCKILNQQEIYNLTNGIRI